MATANYPANHANKSFAILAYCSVSDAIRGVSGLGQKSQKNDMNQINVVTETGDLNQIKTHF